MSNARIESFKRIFTSRLESLEHILERGRAHFGDDAFVAARLAPDMFPLGTQIAFACNQPLGFAAWCEGKPAENLPPEVGSLALALTHVRDARQRVARAQSTDARLETPHRFTVGPRMYVEIPAGRYVEDFLIPNFYFHITTTYAILRMLGAPLGKADYMQFLLADVVHEAAPAQAEAAT